MRCSSLLNGDFLYVIENRVCHYQESLDADTCFDELTESKI